MPTLPHAIQMVSGSIYQLEVVGQDACLKVTPLLSFHAHACSRQVCRAYVCRSAIEYHYLEMHTRTQPSVETSPKTWETVEVCPEIIAWLFGMQQPHFYTAPQQSVNHC